MKYIPDTVGTDEAPKMDAYGPNHYGGSPVTLHVYVPDVDATAKQATAAGAKLIRPVADQFYGDRTAGFQDPFGHKWHFATHIREVAVEELQHHMRAATTGQTSLSWAGRQHHAAHSTLLRCGNQPDLLIHPPPEPDLLL